MNDERIVLVKGNTLVEIKIDSLNGEVRVVHLTDGVVTSNNTADALALKSSANEFATTVANLLTADGFKVLG